MAGSALDGNPLFLASPDASGQRHLPFARAPVFWDGRESDFGGEGSVGQAVAAGEVGR